MNSGNIRTLTREESLLLIAGSVLLLLNAPFFQTFFFIAAIWSMAIGGSEHARKIIAGGLNVIALFLSAHQFITYFEPSAGNLRALQIATWLTLAFLLFWQVALSLIRKIPGRWPHLVVLFLVLALLWATRLPWAAPKHIEWLHLGLTWLSIRTVWFMAACAYDGIGQRKGSALNGIKPFWNPTPVPYSHETARNQDERLQLIRSGIRLLAYTFGIRIALDLLSGVGTQNLLAESAYSYVFRDGDGFYSLRFFYDFYRSPLLSLGDRWIIALGGFFVHLFSLIWITGIYVATGRLAGYSVYRYIYRPFPSRSFYQLLTRTNYFYVEVISRLWMNPLLSYFSFVRKLEIRIAVSAFLSVFGFGCMYHFLRFPGLLLKTDDAVAWARLSNYSLYYFVVAILAAISVASSLRTSSPRITGNHALAAARLWGTNFIYLLVYAATFSLIGTDFFRISSTEHLGFVLGLFEPIFP